MHLPIRLRVSSLFALVLRSSAYPAVIDTNSQRPPSPAASFTPTYTVSSTDLINEPDAVGLQRRLPRSCRAACPC